MADASKQTESKESQKQMGLFEDLLQMLVNDDAMSKDDLVELYKNVLRKRDLIEKNRKTKNKSRKKPSGLKKRKRQKRRQKQRRIAKRRKNRRTSTK